MLDKILKKSLARWAEKLLPTYFEVEQARKAPIGAEFPIEGALPDVRALGRTFELVIVAKVKK